MDSLGNHSLRILFHTTFAIVVISFLHGCALKDPYVSSSQVSYREIMNRQKTDLPTDIQNQRDGSSITAETCESFGDYQLKHGNMDGAFVQYDRALRLDPENLRVRYKIGHLFLERRLPDEALKEFEKILKLDSSYTLAYEGMGQALMQMGRYDQAEKNFYQAIELDSNLWLSHNFLGMIYDRRLCFDEAIVHYERAIGLKSDEDFLFNNLGMSYYLKGDYEKSAQMLRKAIEVKPSSTKNPKIYNNLGLALGRLERYEEALNTFEKVGDRAAAYNNLGCIYLEQEKYEEATAAFKKAIEIKSTFYEKASENLERAKMAQKTKKRIMNNTPPLEKERIERPLLPAKEKEERTSILIKEAK